MQAASGAVSAWRRRTCRAYPLIELARRVEQVVEGLIVVAVREGARGRMSAQAGARMAERAACGAAGRCSAPMQRAHAPRMQGAHPRSASALRAAASLVSLAALRWGAWGWGWGCVMRVCRFKAQAQRPKQCARPRAASHAPWRPRTWIRHPRCPWSRSAYCCRRSRS